MKNNTLIEKIREAFKDTKYPGDEKIVTNFDTYDLTQEMWQAFKSKHWRDITADQVEDWRLDLGNFTAQGFYFYLPAFLIAALDEEDPKDVGSYLIFSFDPSRRDAIDEYVAMLTSSQKAVIKQYVQQFYKHSPHYLDEGAEQTKIFWGIED